MTSCSLCVIVALSQTLGSQLHINDLSSSRLNFVIGILMFKSAEPDPNQYHSTALTKTTVPADLSLFASNVQLWDYQSKVRFLLIPIAPSPHPKPLHLHYHVCLKPNCPLWRAAAACAGRRATWPATTKSYPWSKFPARPRRGTCRRSSTSRRSTSRE